jgi:hypothetical protein
MRSNESIAAASRNLRLLGYPDSGGTVAAAKTRIVRPMHLLDGVPPDTRVVIANVTWDVYENLVD